jgi:putative transposase
MLLDKNYKSYFELLKLKEQGLYENPVKPPKYLDSISGRQILTYCKQAISFKEKGFIKLSKTTIKLKTDREVQFVRLVPKNGYYIIEIGYNEKPKNKLKDNYKYASIDIGVNNLATITSNVFSPVIVNGKPLKSINQYYNKRVAQLTSISETLNKQKTTKRIKSIGRIRNNKIEDYMHKASRYIVNHLVSTDINTLIIGYNEGWKQDTTQGKANNQKFVNIPFCKFIHMISYKCELEGIRVILHEESYTSKCSFIDQDYIPTYSIDDNLLNSSGKRIKRGLYKSKNGLCINADVNGSYNIMRKTLTEQEVWNENLFSNCIEVCSTPLVKSF